MDSKYQENLNYLAGVVFSDHGGRLPWEACLDIAKDMMGEPTEN